MKKVLLAAVALAALAAGGGYWVTRGGSGGGYRLAKVERGSLAAVVAASGTVNAVNTVPVRAPIAGEMKEIFADFNTPVKKDQVLARLDAATFEQRVTQARADLDAAEAAAALARSGSKARRPELQLAIAAVRQRESLLKQAQADLERTVIRAPVDGTVVLRNVDAGQNVVPGEQAAVLFTIAQDLRAMQVEAAIGEADAARLREGMPAEFTVGALPRRRFFGELRQVRKTPREGAAYSVLISAPNPDLALLPGMRASVRIEVESRDSVLKVPNAALRWRPDGAAPPKAATPTSGRVWILQRGSPQPVAVRTGLSDGVSTELVQSPLAEGTQVIVGTLPAGKTAALNRDEASRRE